MDAVTDTVCFCPGSQSTSASKLPTPSVEGADTLSDYIPQSNEISRVPSTAGGPDEDAERRGAVDEAEDEEEDDEYDSEGNVVMQNTAANGKGKNKTAVKKEAKRKLDNKVSESGLLRQSRAFGPGPAFRLPNPLRKG